MKAIFIFSTMHRKNLSNQNNQKSQRFEKRKESFTPRAFVI
ncbi:hypothetical protein HMPREF1555_02102 [Porphyromonas gingivalis F0570]|uniref:Uncharacterized protein n=1 Tax=Porphyromonas gingivalis F0570 TaxID=1227271 RepID=A0A0E2LMZ9_PORGN|nr:hypothetical protein HMPREF1555_02102 [Porphyromonas gingivalis F0570]